MPLPRPLIARMPALLALALGGAAAGRGEVDFNREVRPILSDKCFHCHGPDEANRKGKLRLDTREGALRVRDGVAPIVPGRAADSELLKRITSPHEDEVMPPPESKLGRLTSAEAEVLRRWIEEGAAYRAHGSFEKLAPVPVPAAAGATPADVVKVSVFLTDVDDRPRINPLRQEFFGSARPASTLVEVSRLPVPGMLVEMEAVVQLPGPNGAEGAGRSTS